VNDDEKKTDEQPSDRGAGEELREGLRHLFSAARKVVKTAEPTVSRSLEDVERVIGKLGRGGEAVASEIGREVAGLATKLADKLRAVSERGDGGAPEERTPPAPPTGGDRTAGPGPTDDSGGGGSGNA
jgi:hypothetical protein